MQRVWRGRRDLVVELSRRYAHRRERREIITVDQVVGDAWMVGLLFCFFVQYCGGLELLGVVPIVEIDRTVQRKRVKIAASLSSG